MTKTPMRAVWSGVLAFGQVNIPMRLLSGSRPAAHDFVYLHKSDRGRIRHVRMCEADGKPVPFTDVVWGVPTGSGEYVVLDPDDYALARPRSSKIMEIRQFVDPGDVDPMYVRAPYYMEPDRHGDVLYSLVTQALAKAGRAAIATVVLRTREHLMFLKPLGDMLIAHQLRYAHELHAADVVRIPARRHAPARDMQLATRYIEQETRPFRPELYADSQARELKVIIARKRAGETPLPERLQPVPTDPARWRDLLAANLLRSGKRT